MKKKIKNNQNKLIFNKTKDKSFYRNYLKEVTLSSSGWRKIFAIDNNQNSLSSQISKVDKDFLQLAGWVIGQYFYKKIIKNSTSSKQILIARDSRPTGINCEKNLLASINNLKIPYQRLGVTSLPECVATVKESKNLCGYIYISASHNPPGYNGIKIGNSRGEIIAAITNQNLSKALVKQFIDGNFPNLKLSKAKPPKIIHNSKAIYQSHLDKISGYNQKKIKNHLEEMEKEIKTQKPFPNPAIIADFNGSARINSIDKNFIKKLGLKFFSINNQLGCFPHAIVPEGKSLLELKNAMESSKWKNKNILFGYAVDCDGDRGNILLYQSNNTVIAPDAQTTFALAAIARLSLTELFYPQKINQTAVVVNGPTSLRIDHLVKQFGAKLFRSEVGESNVIKLAKKLSNNHFISIIGEGSNGGCIIPPSVVRDPLTMIVSLVQLLFLKNDFSSLKEIAIKRLNAPKKLLTIPNQFFLASLLPYLNTFQSTSVFEPQSVLKIKNLLQKEFKKNYEIIFKKEWDLKKSKLTKGEIIDYQFINYEGIHTYYGEANRHNLEDGGLKVAFYNYKKEQIGFLWFRFSKTEPVLRLSAEHRQSTFQKSLFTWQKQILLKTDKNTL